MYFEYSVPFKKGKEIACFNYDYAFYCDMLYQLFPPYCPDFLENYLEHIRFHSKLLNSMCKPLFPAGYRVYIFDNRCNTLFATIDTTGKICNFFDEYCSLKHHSFSSLYFNNYPNLSKEFYPSGYNTVNLIRFSRKYNFIPIEELFASFFMFLKEDEMLDFRAISQYQTQILLEKYKKNNYIDWRQLVRDINLETSFSLP